MVVLLAEEHKNSLGLNLDVEVLIVNKKVTDYSLSKLRFQNIH